MNIGDVENHRWSVLHLQWWIQFRPKCAFFWL